MTYTFVNVKVEPAGLTVTATDATSDHIPTNNEPGTPDEEGRQFYYKPVKVREAKWVLYCTKLGAALARELKKAKKDIAIPNEVLTDLPEGYRLFEHIKNYIHEPKKYRTDTYLFGFGSTKFRSPAEFEDHLLWLASDQSIHCLCKYCSRDSTPKKKIQATSQGSSRRTPQKSSPAITPSSSSAMTSNQVVLRSESKSSRDSTPKKKMQATSQGSSRRTPQKSSPAITPSSSSAMTSNQVVLRSKSKKRPPSDVNPSNTNIDSSGVNSCDANPSDVNMSHFSRNGEIVWIKTSLILTENYLEELRKGKVKIEHWPGYVVERQKFSQIVNNATSGPLIDNTHYKVQPLNVVGTRKASEEQIVPWLLLSSESLVEKIYKMRDANRGKDSTLMHVIDLFCLACDIARKISKTYTPLDSYKYTLPPFFLLKVEDQNERQLLQEMEKYMHYKTLCFGSEILKEDDYVRMNDTESRGDNIRIFKINTIYKNSDNKILFNGDIYLKAFTKGNKTRWSRLNNEDKEYFIELKEISGRYYDKCPYINNSMEVNEVISLNERKEIIEGQGKKKTAKHSISSDTLPNIPPTKKLKTQNENKNTTQQEQNDQQDKDVQHSSDDEFEKEVQQKVDPIIISPSIPFLDESEDEISEKESKLFEMLSSHPESPQLMAR